MRVLRWGLAKPMTRVVGEPPHIRLGWPRGHPRSGSRVARLPPHGLGWARAATPDGLWWHVRPPCGLEVVVPMVTRHPRRLPNLSPSLFWPNLSTLLSLLVESLSLSLSAGVVGATPRGRRRRSKATVLAFDRGKWWFKCL
jgi:hypothetical protein